MFKDVIKVLLEKVNAIVGRRKLSGPDSEYASPAISHKGGTTKVDPSTGICVHRNNPSGICCTNEACVGKSRAETHDKDHCYWPGDGMKNSAPPWACNRAKAEMASPAITTTHTSTSTSSSTTSSSDPVHH